MAPAWRGRALLTHRDAARRHPQEMLRYLLAGKEIDNLTYDIANTDDLVAPLAEVLDVSMEDLAGYLHEAQNDRELHQRLVAALRTRRDRPNTPRFARRLGWYMAVRAEKPRVIFETGTHDGLGSALILRALERNAGESHPGELYSFDINQLSGWLVPPDVDSWHPIIGDSRKTLPIQLSATPPDLFIHDIMHTKENERFEFEGALASHSGHLVLITDNAHVTTVLADIARRHDLRHAEFAEQPVRTWYPGVKLGIALRP